MKLYKHKNNLDIAAEVLSIMKVPGKDYCRIKVRWWNIGPHTPFCMNITQRLTDATIKGNKRQREKYPIEKWRDDWEVIHV